MTTLNDLLGSRWSGSAELWEDPLGDVAQRSDASVAIDDGVVSYTWSYQGKDQTGSIRTKPGGAVFSDTWHQGAPVAAKDVPDSRALFAFSYTYMENWAWRVSLSLREPTGELVLQMTNIAPWGEEARAFRLVCTRVAG